MYRHLEGKSSDPANPVKYDFALIGLGVFEGFKPAIKIQW
jgi:hypothetical protein